MYIIKAINDKNILINDVVYPTPVVALSLFADKVTVRLYSRELFIVAFSYKDIEVIDFKGNITSGATADRESIVKAINEIGNIKSTLGNDYFTKLEMEVILKEYSGINHYHGYHSPVSYVFDEGNDGDIGIRSLFKVLHYKGTTYNNVISFIYKGSPVFEFLTEGDKVYSIQDDREYILKDTLQFYDSVEPKSLSPLRRDSSGRVLTAQPTELMSTEYWENQAITIKYLWDLAKNANKISSGFTGEELILIDDPNENTKPKAAKLKDILDNLVQRPLQVRGTITSESTIPSPSTLRNGDVYLVRLDNGEEEDPILWTLKDPNSDFIFKNLDLVAWTSVDGESGHWIDLGQIDTIVNLYETYTNSTIEIFNTAGRGITLKLADHVNKTAGLLSPEYSSDIEESNSKYDSSNRYYPERTTLVRRDDNGHFETKDHTHNDNSHLDDFDNKEVLNWNDINHLINRDSIRLRYLKEVSHLDDLEAGFYDSSYIYEIINAPEFPNVQGHKGFVVITRDYKSPETKYYLFIDTTDSCMYEIVNGEFKYINDRRIWDLIPNVRNTVLKLFTTKNQVNLNEWYTDNTGNLFLTIQDQSGIRHLLSFNNDKGSYDNKDTNRTFNIFKIRIIESNPDTSEFTENHIQVINNPINPLPNIAFIRGTIQSPAICKTEYNGNNYESYYIIKTDKAEYKFYWKGSKWILINDSDISHLGTIEDFKRGLNIESLNLLDNFPITTQDYSYD
jgi:hypothetical protein